MTNIIAQKLKAASKQLEAAQKRIVKYDAGNAQNIEAAAWLAKMAADMAEEYKVEGK